MRRVIFVVILLLSSSLAAQEPQSEAAPGGRGGRGGGRGAQPGLEPRIVSFEAKPATVRAGSRCCWSGTSKTRRAWPSNRASAR